LQQELDHIDLAKVACHMQGRVTGLGLWVHCSAALDKHLSTVDLILLRTQMQWGQSILRCRSRISLMLDEQRGHLDVALLTRQVQRRETGIGLAVGLCLVLKQVGCDVELVFLSGDVKSGVAVLGDYVRTSSMLEE